MSRPKVAVLLSGGVDSSTVLGMLAQSQQYELTAYYLKIWLEDDLAFLGDCPWQEDLEYARKAAELFGVPLKVISLQSEYHEQVVAYALSELRIGHTPSPDIFCNQRIKFGAFFRHLEHQCDFVASGHYAGVCHSDAKLARLKRGLDPVKDQSYFLSHLSQEQLRRCLFPLGDMSKSEVRKLAVALGVPSANRPDSQGICFLGKIRFRDFVAAHLGEQKGAIIDADTGNQLGHHRGYWFHTIGQRKGLGLGGGPWFVTAKDTDKNVVYVRHESLEPEFRPSEFSVGPIHWISRAETNEPFLVKVRHGPALLECEVEINQQGGARVRLCRPDRGLANGQFAVFYQGRYCLGSGMIQ